MPDINDDLYPGSPDDEEEVMEETYCEYCDFGYGIPEDDCYCEENCGAIGCQGQD